MKQTRLTSLMKSLVSTGVGFAVAFVANALIMPLFGFDLSHSANLLLTTIYTVISIARGYMLERVFEALGWRQRISPFMSAVIAERQRQQDVEGWSIEHDDAHERGDLASAGAAYVVGASVMRTTGDKEDCKMAVRIVTRLWPWDLDWMKPAGFRRDLVKGTALIVAEGEKFDRSRKSRGPSANLTTEPSAPAEPSRCVVQNPSLAHDKSKSEHGGSSA